MAQADFGTGKTLAVLAIVLGCFAILWPKIFYPMWQAAFAMSSPKLDSDGRYRETERPPHLHPGSINPRMKATPENIHEKFMMREGRPFPHPQARQPVKPQPKSGGAMGIIMPIYTVGIIVFFIYTVLKLVFKKNPDEQKKPLIKDFHMDPEYRKFVCQQMEEPPPKPAKRTTKKKKSKSITTIHENSDEYQAEELDAKDYEISQLKKKLEEMQTLMKLRNRRKGDVKKTDDSETSQKWHIEEDDGGEEEDDLPSNSTKTTVKSFDSSSDLMDEDVGESEGENDEDDSCDEDSDGMLEDMIRSEDKRKTALT